ncbi:MAG: hypothetical protein KF774_06425 [Planctomyces sp.]|nr:hypothetical protein [Planctomyces sp.]
MPSTKPQTELDLSLADRIVSQIEELILDAEQAQKPLELEPYRSRLFELFVTAEGAGYLADDARPDLTADGLCQTLADRWGLRTAAQDSVREQARIPAEHMARMRSLWSMMRLWMEWTYAWSRWEEFHQGRAAGATGTSGQPDAG